MYRPSYFMVPLLALCLTSCGRALLPNAPGPVVVENADHVAPAVLLSEMSEDTKPYEQVFVLVNQADEPRTIRVVGTSCYCVGLTLGEAGKELKVGDVISLAPGERRSGKVLFKPALRAESQSQSAAFESTGPNGEVQNLVVTMVVPVLADTTASPPVLSHDFTGPVSGPVEKKLVVQSTRRCKDARSAEPHFNGLPPEVQLVQVSPRETREVEPGIWTQSWEVTFAIHASDRVGSALAGRMIVSFGTSPTPFLHVPITVRQRFGIETLPKVVDFGAVARGEVCTRRILLSSPSDRAFTILKAVSSSPQLTVSWNTPRPSPRQWVEISLKADGAGPCKGEITIETSHPEAPLVKIKVDGISPQ